MGFERITLALSKFYTGASIFFFLFGLHALMQALSETKAILSNKKVLIVHAWGQIQKDFPSGYDKVLCDIISLSTVLLVWWRQNSGLWRSI
jgi:hypothetical protein